MFQALRSQRRSLRAPLFTGLVLAFLIACLSRPSAAADPAIPDTLSGPFTLYWSLTVRRAITPERLAEIRNERIRAWNKEVERGKISRAQADRIIADIRRATADRTGVEEDTESRTHGLCLASDGKRVMFSLRRTGERCGIHGMTNRGSRTSVWDGRRTVSFEGDTDVASVAHYFDLAEGMHPLVLPGVNLPFLPFVEGKPLPKKEGATPARVLYTVDRYHKTGEYLDADVSVKRENGRFVIQRAMLKRQGDVVRSIEFGPYRRVGKALIPTTIAVEDYRTINGRSEPEASYSFVLGTATAALEADHMLDPERYLGAARYGYTVRVTDDRLNRSFRFDPKKGSLDTQLEQHRAATTPATAPSSMVGWIAAAIVVIALAAGLVWMNRRRRLG